MNSAATEELSTRQFQVLAEFVKSKIGLHLRDEKRMLVQSRLIKRLKALGLNDFESYMACLRNDQNGQEMAALAQALTTNVTSFFRESHHFEALATLAKTDLAQRLSSGEVLRLWSAGSSTGAEAYTMAMILCETLPSRSAAQIKILATDIDTAVLAKARSGVYSEREVEGMNQEYLSKYFTPCQGGYQIDDSLRAMVQFKTLNLIEPWPLTKTFSVIFCRNVVIYFDAQTQAALWQRFLRQLEPNGHLIIGHSERLDGETLSMVTSRGVTTYQKSEMQGAKA